MYKPGDPDFRSSATGAFVRDALRALASIDRIVFADPNGKMCFAKWKPRAVVPAQVWAVLPQEARLRVPVHQWPADDPPRTALGTIFTPAFTLKPLLLLPPHAIAAAVDAFDSIALVDGVRMPGGDGSEGGGKSSRFMVTLRLKLSAQPLAVESAEALCVRHALPGGVFSAVPSGGRSHAERWRAEAAKTIADSLCTWAKSDAALPTIEAVMRNAGAGAGATTKRA